MLASLNTAKDTRTEAPSEKVIIDKGEQVHTNTSHHVHHLVQPVIERDTHEHHKTHTGTYSSFTRSTSPRIDQFLSSKFSVVPVHQETHEAPIVHQSVAHEPMALKDFVSGGGDLKSTVKHDASLLTRNEDCERTVDGPAETLKSTLGLGNNNNTTSTTTDNTRI